MKEKAELKMADLGINTEPTHFYEDYNQRIKTDNIKKPLFSGFFVLGCPSMQGNA
jgi:hypothetical protein